MLIFHFHEEKAHRTSEAWSQAVVKGFAVAINAKHAALVFALFILR